MATKKARPGEASGRPGKISLGANRLAGRSRRCSGPLSVGLHGSRPGQAVRRGHTAAWGVGPSSTGCAAYGGCVACTGCAASTGFRPGPRSRQRAQAPHRPPLPPEDATQRRAGSGSAVFRRVALCLVHLSSDPFPAWEPPVVRMMRREVVSTGRQVSCANVSGHNEEAMKKSAASTPKQPGCRQDNRAVQPKGLFGKRQAIRPPARRRRPWPRRPGTSPAPCPARCSRRPGRDRIRSRPGPRPFSRPPGPAGKSSRARPRRPGRT